MTSREQQEKKAASMGLSWQEWADELLACAVPAPDDPRGPGERLRRMMFLSDMRDHRLARVRHVE